MSEPLSPQSARLLADVNIIMPRARDRMCLRDYAANAGTILVRSRRGSFATERARLTVEPKFLGVIIDPGDLAAPDFPPQFPAAVAAPFFELLLETASPPVYAGRGPVTGVPPGMPRDRRVRAAMYTHNSGTGAHDLDMTSIDETDFIAIDPAAQATVSAGACLWLAFAAPGTVLNLGPEHFDEGDANRPVKLDVPANATGATVTATASWTHRKGVERLVDANGRDDLLTGLQKPEIYQNTTLYPTLNSGHISSNAAALPLGKLVGLWDRGPGVATAELELGASATPTVPPEAQRRTLFLGFHDGYEWTNNDGSATVNVTWVAE